MSNDMSVFTFSRRHSLRRLLLGLGVFAVIGHLILRGETSWFRSHDEAPVGGSTSKYSFIMASRKSDNTTWIKENFPNWGLIRYVVDDPEAQYTVPKNKGREAMVYLTWVLHH